MVEIPESLLRRSAEAKAKALGVPVEQVLAEMKGEGPPVEPQHSEPEGADTEEVSLEEGAPEAVEEVPAEDDAGAESPEVDADMEQDVPPEEPKEATAPSEESPAEDDAGAESPEVDADMEQDVPPEEPKEATAPSEESPAAMVAEAGAVAVAEVKTAEAEADEAEDGDDEEIPVVDVEDLEDASGDGSGNGAGDGKVAAMVSPRPTVPPAGLPEGVRTQRLLTVVKARAIQNVKAEPTDKVNTWPHLMLMEFGALLAITGLLVIMAVVIHSPLLEPANFNATPNPSKAPWYFLGLQELLSYFDPQIAGVMVPLFIGMIGFMMIPYVDKNPSTRPTDRKFAIMLYSLFLAGSATLTIIGVLFRGQGFNFTYPWRDGVFFDDLKDWVHFE
jgi:menaquinol-cytochrome c reductase cytochrome b/c subunit